MKFLKDRNLIIIAIILILLIGGYYVTNTGKKTSTTTSQNDQVKLDDSGAKTTTTPNTPNTSEPISATSKDIVSSSPSANSISTTKPTKVSLNVYKTLAAGSEIKVVSDKNVDVVSGGNTLSVDLKNLTAPVLITALGTYTVTYSLNWVGGGTSTGTYKFTVK